MTVSHHCIGSSAMQPAADKPLDHQCALHFCPDTLKAPLQPPALIKQPYVLITSCAFPACCHQQSWICYFQLHVSYVFQCSRFRESSSLLSSTGEVGRRQGYLGCDWEVYQRQAWHKGRLVACSPVYMYVTT